VRERQLIVGLEQVAELRDRSGTWQPEPVAAAALATLAGADGVSLALRAEGGRAQERDARLLRETQPRSFGLELSASTPLVRLALEVRPDWVVVSERRPGDERRGASVDLLMQTSALGEVMRALDDAKIATHLCVLPDFEQIKTAHRFGAAGVRVDTTRYAQAAALDGEELKRIADAARFAHKLGLAVSAGGALDYQSARGLASQPDVRTLHVGRAVVARAVLVGLERAVVEMRALVA
jgi:pyridoxine 5-phosphate synthase